MLKRQVLPIILISFGLSCKGPQVVSFVNPSMDFSQYETYRIESTVDGASKPKSDSSAIGNEIEKLLNMEMTGRKYEYSPKSDLRLQYSFIANNKTDIDVTPNYYSRNRFYNPYTLPYNSYNIRQRNFYEAILLVELKNRAAKTVWQGSLDLRYTKKIKNKDQILPTAVMKIFETYPYQAGSNQQVVSPDN